ncbi:MAG: hypothetical protein GXY67_07990 [Clostridiales bacterium]|nr:hypothetical protein [Clostridiales bacterium]
MSISLTKKELATVAGYTYRRLYDIDRDLPKEQKLFVEGEGGKYDLALFVQRWVAYCVDSQSGTDMDLDEVKAKHEQVKMAKSEIELARMRGEVVAVADVKRVWADIAHAVTQNMMLLPSKVAPVVVGMKSTMLISGVIEEAVREVLNLIADTPLPSQWMGASEDEESEGASEE